MMALAATDATSTSTLHLQPLPLTLLNTVAEKFGKINTQMIVLSKYPMANDGNASPHHESCHLVDLAKI